MQHLSRINLINCPNSFGIYKIYAFTKDDVAIPISRFAGIDKTGLLYIGQTTEQNFSTRLGNFLRVTNPALRTTNHTGALKYKRSETIRRVLGEGHKLYFVCETCDSPKKLEKELLNQYAVEFGEYPPLNG